jgi:hypothetical protein
MVLGSLCLIDADVAIDGFKYSYFEALVTGHAIGMCGWVRTQEVQFYKDPCGARVAIDLTTYVTTGVLQVQDANAVEMHQFASAYRGRALGRGESESIAMVMSRGYYFCTADRPAVKVMKQLGVLNQWVSLEELLSCLTPPLPIPEPKFSRAAAQPK